MQPTTPASTDPITGAFRTSPLPIRNTMPTLTLLSCAYFPRW
jgi:hypothetical protein